MYSLKSSRCSSSSATMVSIPLHGPEGGVAFLPGCHQLRHRLVVLGDHHFLAGDS